MVFIWKMGVKFVMCLCVVEYFWVLFVVWL